ncbi:hypothetical protein HDU91_007250, partial [Kappamyces sp. JEL0680]
DVERLVQTRLYPSFTIKSTNTIAKFRATYRVADTFWNGHRIFLAGDAAHSTSPSQGLGLNYGCADAQNIGWKLASVLNGWSSPKILASYDKERRGAAKALVGLGRQNQMLFNYLHPWAQRFRRAIIKYATTEASLVQQTGLVTGLGQTYRSFLTGRGVDMRTTLEKRFGKKRLEAGELFPSGLLTMLDPETQLSGGWKVILLCTHPPLHPIALAKGLLKTTLIRQVYVVRRGEHEALWSKTVVTKDCCLLLRPDGYISYRSDDQDVDAMLYFLSRTVECRFDHDFSSFLDARAEKTQKRAQMVRLVGQIGLLAFLAYRPTILFEGLGLVSKAVRFLVFHALVHVVVQFFVRYLFG